MGPKYNPVYEEDKMKTIRFSIRIILAGDWTPMISGRNFFNIFCPKRRTDL